MRSAKYCRRQFLASIGLGAAALPLLEAGDAFGNCLLSPPTRIVFMVYPNGIDGTGKSYITGADTNFALPAWMKTSPVAGGVTLEAVRDEMVFLDGVAVSINEKTGLGSHEARPAVFSSSPLELNDGHMNHNVIGGGATIDQVIADQLTKQGIKTPRQVLNLGVRSSEYRASWRGKGDPVQPELNPYKLASALFAGPALGAAEDPSLARRLKTRRLIMDQKRVELERFKKRLGTADQRAADSWMASLDTLQKELAAPVSGSGCESPNLGAALDITKTENHPKLLKAQFDLTVAALAADVSRVAMIEIDNSIGNETFFSWLGADFAKTTGTEDSEEGNNHHAISHQNGAKKTTVDSWYHSQFGYFIDRLRSVKEGNGTLLDNTIVVVTSDGRNGAEHSVNDVPYLLAGGKNMGIKRGRYLKLANVPKQQVLAAVAQAMGAELADFGGQKALAGLR